LFNESHSNMPLKEYIRKWSNWVIDFHWISTLKFFIDYLPTNKLHFYLKNYPSLDNFILHWMWWSYSLNKDIERFTKDPFRAIGSTPWLQFDIPNNETKPQVQPLIVKAALSRDQAEKEFNATLRKYLALIVQQQEHAKPCSRMNKTSRFNECTVRSIGDLLADRESQMPRTSTAIATTGLHRSNSYPHLNEIDELVLSMTGEEFFLHESRNRMDFQVRHFFAATLDKILLHQ